MIVKLQIWIVPIDEQEDLLGIESNNIIPNGYYEEEVIRLDKIDKYRISNDKTEIVITLGGFEYFYDYDEIEYDKIKRYFNLLETNFN